MVPFSYIREFYRVPASLYREVIVDGKRGVIMQDMGNYIGVVFYNEKQKPPAPCHPTWRVEYLDTFNSRPPKPTKSQKRYQEYLNADWFGGTFGEWIRINK